MWVARVRANRPVTFTLDRGDRQFFHKKIEEMTERYTEFLVDLTGKAPRNLKDSIRRVRDASAGFRNSWLNGERSDAYETSQEAFAHLDFIQSELLRHRDVQEKMPGWDLCPLKVALDAPVGLLYSPVSESDISWFEALTQGEGKAPPGCTAATLTLGDALNKQKHRHTIAVNFHLPEGSGHVLYVLTQAGMSKPHSISAIDVLAFCAASKAAASHV